MIYALQPYSGYVAYDILIVVELEGGAPLSNLALLRGSLEPSSCSTGDERYILGINGVTLSHLLAGCTSEMSLTAHVCFNVPNVHILIFHNVMYSCQTQV